MDDRALADIWVSRDLANPSETTSVRWHEGWFGCVPLRGGIPHPGTAVAYKRALLLTRRIFVPTACQAARPDGMLGIASDGRAGSL